MAPSRLRFLFVLLITAIGIIGIAIFTLKPPQHAQTPNRTSFGSTVSSLLSSIPDTFSKPKAPPKFAYVAFLEEFSGANKAEDADDEGEEDAYYTGKF